MKTKIYTFLAILAILMPAALRSEVITGTSEPFVFGDPPPVPLSPIALVVAVLLIGAFLAWRYFSAKKQAA